MFSVGPKKLKERAAVICGVRSFFMEHGYLEVDTPLRLPTLLPEACIEPEVSGDWFLQTSPELCMKRLLAAGLPKIFQICKCFRKNERGRTHLPEMTMLEWYAVGHNYFDLMGECEKLFQKLCPGKVLEYAGHSINLNAPWPRVSLEDAFAGYAAKSLAQSIVDGDFEETLVSQVEPHLGVEHPVFLYDYPASMASLAALDPQRPMVAQRFELYLAGLEVANGFSELNDATEQRQRFELERQQMVSVGRVTSSMPETFLADLERMPSAAGIALGLDRLVMLLTEAKSIDQVVAFTPEEL